MILVTERDMKDAKDLGERSGITSMDDWDYFVHDIAQSIADGRREAWQPIETAPKDGTEILLFNSLGNRHIGRWGHRYLGDPQPDGWTWDGKQIGGYIRSWMPLPEPPALTAA